MIDYAAPQPQIDLDTLPPVITSAGPGTFAHETLRVRQSANLRAIIARNDFPPDINAALEALHAEVVGGRVQGLTEPTPDRAFWDPAVQPHLGRNWLDIPWYFAEAYLFRRVLEATCYFQPGPWQGFDPFAVHKQSEWQPEAAPAAVQRLLATSSPPPALPTRALLLASLWGNRADLSYAAAAQLAKEQESADEHLLIDDSRAVSELLRGRTDAHVIFIADNAGTELLMDLALIDHLLDAGLAGRVSLHLKPQPFFVSDATIRDVAEGLNALPAGGEQAGQLAQRLWARIDAGHLVLRTHWFYATSLFYFQLPQDLRGDLSHADLVLVKGDANYRRLVGDAHWPYTTPFARATAYFPAPLVVLRTLKGEVMLGLEPGQAERLQAEDPDWLVNGRRGVIQMAAGAGATVN